MVNLTQVWRSKQLPQIHLRELFFDRSTALILPETTLEQANMLAEKFGNIVSKETICFEDEDEKVELKIGLSIGVACYPTHASDAEILISAADHALCRAKEYKVLVDKK